MGDYGAVPARCCSAPCPRARSSPNRRCAVGVLVNRAGAIMAAAKPGPGGIMPFCEPDIVTSTPPHHFVGDQPRRCDVSTINSASCFAALIAADRLDVVDDARRVSICATRIASLALAVGLEPCLTSSGRTRATRLSGSRPDLHPLRRGAPARSGTQNEDLSARRHDGQRGFPCRGRWRCRCQVWPSVANNFFMSAAGLPSASAGPR